MITKDTNLITAPSGRILKIRVIRAGHNFGCVGQVIARNGRVVAETEPCPKGFDESALTKARELVAAL